MGTRGHTFSLCCGKILRERDEFGNMCLVVDGEFVWAKLVCGVMIHRQINSPTDKTYHQQGLP